MGGLDRGRAGKFHLDSDERHGPQQSHLPTPQEDFATIVRAHQQRVLRTLARLLGSQEQVEDLAQEVFLRLHRAWPHFQGRAQVSTYLYRIAVNVARDEHNRQRTPLNRAVSLSDPDADWESRLARQDPAADTLLSRKELWAIVTAALQELSDAERAVIVLYHQEERSYEEIARILDLPINTVRTHLHRGRERLGRLVRERCRHDV